MLSITLVQRSQAMYNLTVAVAHTFFVGDQQWLVHNAKEILGCLSDAAKALGWGNGSSEALRANLKAAGLKTPPFMNAAHHIVAHTHMGALPSIEVMVKYGIHADDATNGVFLRMNDVKGAGVNHDDIHTNVYFAELNRRTTAAQSKNELILILRDIADELRLDVFPY